MGGPDFDVDRFVGETRTTVLASWRKGDARQFPKGDTRPYPRSGVNVEADGGEYVFGALPRQVEQALGFLAKHGDELRRVTARAEHTYALLDFTSAFTEDTMTKTVEFPPKLVQAAADAGLGLTVSFYPVAP